MAIRRCPYCKAIIDESQKYCNNCGTQLLFPADEAEEEPIKGEKIVDEDFKDVVEGEDDGEEDERLLTKDEADLEEIDLEEVLEGSGHFPDEPEAEREPEPEAKPKPRARRAPQPPAPQPPAELEARDPELEPVAKPVAKPVRRAAAKPTPRAPRKAVEAKPKLDTKEEIAKLIAVLEEKERQATGPIDGEPKRDEPPVWAPTPPPAFSPPPPPSPASPPAPDPEPVPPVMERKPGLDAAWEELLRKPPTVDVEGERIEIPRIPDTSPEEDLYGAVRKIGSSFRGDEAEGAGDEGSVLEPPSSLAPGDTMDFQQEVMSRTPLEIPRPPVAPAPPPEPTRMGIPERITREEIFQDRDENETPPESVFDDMRLRPSPPTPSTAELLDREPSPRRRMGFFRKAVALIFDAAFIAAIWGLALWLAGRLMGLTLPELVTMAPVASGVLLAALLGSYFFLFLFFLGETLGDRMASPKS